MGLFDYSLSAERLMVIIPDRLSDLIEKGEITDRYYNPGELFKEVHIVMCNDDKPGLAGLQRTVGRAKLVLHNLRGSNSLFIRSMGWRPWLLRRWAVEAVELARIVQPVMIRCHGAWLNAFAAARIKQVLEIPYVVSMHTNPDEDIRRCSKGFIQRLYSHASLDLEKIGLREADAVLPVYRNIVPYLKRIGVERYDICYNTINPSYLNKKDDYSLHDPVRIACVGRQFAEKNPENIIRAISALSNVQLTMVGDGSHYNHLRQVASDCGVAKRVTFHRSLPNDELCRRLPEFDMFAVHNEYWGVPKAVLEPLLTGLPVVINRRSGKPISELTDDICYFVENTVESYRQAFERLIDDHALREKYGRAAYSHAQANWAPDKTEARFVDTYRKVMVET